MARGMSNGPRSLAAILIASAACALAVPAVAGAARPAAISRRAWSSSPRPAVRSLAPPRRAQRLGLARQRPRQPRLRRSARGRRRPLRRRRRRGDAGADARPAAKSSHVSRRYRDRLRGGAAVGAAGDRRRAAGPRRASRALAPLVRADLPVRAVVSEGDGQLERRPARDRTSASTAPASPSASSPTPSTRRAARQRPPPTTSPTVTCRASATPADSTGRSRSSAFIAGLTEAGEEPENRTDEGQGDGRRSSTTSRPAPASSSPRPSTTNSTSPTSIRRLAAPAPG